GGRHATPLRGRDRRRTGRGSHRSRTAQIGLAGPYDVCVRLVLAAVSIALLAPAVALAKSQVSFEDSIPSGSASSVTITTHEAAAFRVRLRVPTAGRARLYVLGREGRKGGPLIRTSNTSGQSSSCQGAAGSFYCSASYESLPKGTYTWRITWLSVVKHGPRVPAHVELTVRW